MERPQEDSQMQQENRSSFAREASNVNNFSTERYQEDRKPTRRKPQKGNSLPIVAVILLFTLVLQSIQCGLSFAIIREMKIQSQKEQEIALMLEAYYKEGQDVGKLQPAATSPSSLVSPSGTGAAHTDPVISSENGHDTSALPAETTSIETTSSGSIEGDGDDSDPVERQQRVNGVMDELQDQISEEISGFSSEWSIYVEDLESGYAISEGKGVSCNDKMISASVIKIFVMAAVYDKINQGELSEAEYYDTIYAMITVSSNDCTNRLVRALGNGDAEAGFDAINEYAQSIGCNATEYNRLMGSWDGEVQNYVSTKDCARLLRMIYDGDCVSPDYSEKMLDIMLHTESSFPHGVPAYIQQAHKTGGIPNLVAGDVAIVYGENPYIACIIYNHPVSEAACDEACREISQLIFDKMSTI